MVIAGLPLGSSYMDPGLLGASYLSVVNIAQSLGIEWKRPALDVIGFVSFGAEFRMVTVAASWKSATGPEAVMNPDCAMLLVPLGVKLTGGLLIDIRIDMLTAPKPNSM